MVDIFGGEELREMIDAFISEASSTPTRQISVKYLSTLGKISVDSPRKTALSDITLRIGPLVVSFAISWPASFILAGCFLTDFCYVCYVRIHTTYISLRSEWKSSTWRASIW